VVSLHVADPHDAIYMARAVPAVPAAPTLNLLPYPNYIISNDLDELWGKTRRNGSIRQVQHAVLHVKAPLHELLLGHFYLDMESSTP
jgi:hypothetical protein